MVTLTDFRTVLDDLVFPECPRWHDGRLWFTDMQDHCVVRIEPDGSATTIVRFDEVPGGIGWLPDGRLLVLLHESQRVMRVEADGSVSLHADVSELAYGTTNDMIVRSDGTAYLGDMGMRIHDPSITARPGQIVMVSPTGEASIAAGDLAAPNGMILTADERTLIVAESSGMRLTSFGVAPTARSPFAPRSQRSSPRTTR